MIVMKSYQLKSVMRTSLSSWMASCQAHPHPRLISHSRCLTSRPRRHRPHHRPYSTSYTKWPLAHRIPEGAWDSHMHLADPAVYPLAPSATYTPSTHTLAEAQAFESAVGIANIVLVQPSVYGTDNSLILDTLRRLGPSRARGVVTIDPSSPPPDLPSWHTLGVRAVRVNISSVNTVLTPEALRALLLDHARICRPLGWPIQLYLPMASLPALEPVVPSLGVPICIDHIGNPSLPRGDAAPDPYAVPGFPALARLLRNGDTYVKLSAPYRLSARDDYADLEPLAREILRLRGRDRVVFATDWPHTRFDGVDVRPWMERVLEWCEGDEKLVYALFKGTAEELWGDRLKA